MQRGYLNQKAHEPAQALADFRAAEASSQRASAAMAFASELRARTDRELNSVLYLGSGLVGFLAVHNREADSDELNRILASVYRYGHHIRNLALAVGYRITYVYPTMKAETRTNPKVVATGGLAPLFAQGAADLFDAVEEDLTMQGLVLIHQFNKDTP